MSKRVLNDEEHLQMLRSCVDSLDATADKLTPEESAFAALDRLYDENSEALHRLSDDNSELDKKPEPC